jgi:hypothetical protein
MSNDRTARDRSRPDLHDAKIALFSRCLGANVTFGEAGTVTAAACRADSAI